MDDRFIVGNALPSALGAAADLYHEVREIRLAMQKEVDAVEAREKEIKGYIIDNGSTREGETGWSGLRYRAQIVPKDNVKVADWPTFYTWIMANERLDLLEKRLAKTAASDYVEATKAYPPGTEKFIYKDLSVTKI